MAMMRCTGLKILALAGLALVHLQAHAQQPPCPAPAEADGGPSNAHTRYLERHLQPAVIAAGDAPFRLADRMQAYGVPGVSVAVIHRGRLEWARGWGYRDRARCAPVTPDTAFQAASISKLATATLALRLAEQGKIGLDQDINQALGSWQLPTDPTLAPKGVTLAQLLSHTAGLGVHGFDRGFRPGQLLPTLVQILDGQPPSQNPPVRSVLPAGGQFEYSGGGYVLAQLALSDVSGLTFGELAQRELLAPLGMAHSAFAMPPPASLRANLAFAHANGEPIEGDFAIYPQLAPAGLWASASDLARLLMDLQASAKGKRGHRLSPAMTHRMLRPVKDNWGLGPFLYTDGPLRFGHDGTNQGFQSLAVAYADRGEGVVVLTNGGQGRRLIDEIVRAVATDYGWPEIAAPAAQAKTLPLAVLYRAAGRFHGGGLDVVLEAKPDGLYANAGAPVAERLVTLSPTRFRAESIGVTVEFAPDFSSATMIEGAPPMKLYRVGDAPSTTPGVER
ncbi:class A beta-lactamase-related serine hydrolase [Pseudoxanthomonas composti]|uniref:Class A beta-lactamase-related serine hydrolase n=2 Tax=Pseudoxanthomonas composti TaxID=2137479 RepID=A0A4Q1JX50_9GAMM|nr:class A beta-lactamase-related serine hydrolase [Pseudoxanthomonas composti]